MGLFFPVKSGGPLWLGRYGAKDLLLLFVLTAVWSGGDGFLLDEDHGGLRGVENVGDLGVEGSITDLGNQDTIEYDMGNYVKVADIGSLNTEKLVTNMESLHKVDEEDAIIAVKTETEASLNLVDETYGGSKENGEVCESGSECASGHCSDPSPSMALAIRRCVQCTNNEHCPLGTFCKTATPTASFCSGNPSDPIKSFEQMLRGYDIFLADPLNPENDFLINGAWKTQVLTAYFLSPGSNTGGYLDKVYDVPAGYQYNVLGTCYANFQSEEISRSSSVSKAVSDSISFDGDVNIPAKNAVIELGRRAAVSVGQEWAEEAASSQLTTTTFSECRMWQLERILLAKDHYLLSPKLIEYFDSKQTLTRSDYHGIFKEYGTHIPTVGQFGKKLGAKLTMDSETAENFKNACGSIENGVNVGVPGLFNFGYQSQSNTCTTEKVSTYVQNVQNEVCSIGTAGEATAESWGKVENEVPVIIAKKMIDLCKVLSESPASKNTVDLTECRSHLYSYCTDVLNIADCSYNLDIDCVLDDNCASGNKCVNNKCIDESWSDFLQFKWAPWGDFIEYWSFELIGDDRLNLKTHNLNWNFCIKGKDKINQFIHEMEVAEDCYGNNYRLDYDAYHKTVKIVGIASGDYFLFPILDFIVGNDAKKRFIYAEGGSDPQISSDLSVLGDRGYWIYDVSNKQIKNYKSKRCVDLWINGFWTVTTKLITYECNSGSNQKWTWDQASALPNETKLKSEARSGVLDYIESEDVFRLESDAGKVWHQSFTLRPHYFTPVDEEILFTGFDESDVQVI